MTTPFERSPQPYVQAIAGSPLLWRAGVVGDLLMQVCDVPVIVVFYLLLKPVDHALALLTTLMNLVQTAVLAANKLNLLLPLFLLEDHAYLQVFSPEQLHTLSYLAIKTHSYGFNIGLVFFGFSSVILGYLIYRSGFLPRTLGVLMLVPGALVPAFVGEFSLCVWLIVKGIDLKQWSQRTAQ